MLAQLPACRAEPPCAQVTRTRVTRLERDGAVQILNYEPSVRSCSRAAPARGASRGARVQSLPVVQCVRVRREGPLTGGGVELLALSNPIGLESGC